jgi:membrane-bound serine protease (ClpP class)
MVKENTKRTIKDWLKVLVLLLDEAVAIALVLAALWFFKISLPLWLAIVVALLLGTLVFVTHKLIIPSFHARQVTGREGMIGLVGEVIEPLTPSGVIRIEGEYWKARSVEGNVSAEQEVEILDLKQHVLEVKRKKQ